MNDFIQLIIILQRNVKNSLQRPIPRHLIFQFASLPNNLLPFLDTLCTGAIDGKLVVDVMYVVDELCEDNRPAVHDCLVPKTNERHSISHS